MPGCSAAYIIGSEVIAVYGCGMDFMKPLLGALQRIQDPTLFADERGYQGELKSRLDRALALEIPEDDFAAPQVREEYQKRADAHGIRLRPDIIIHVPFE